MKTTSLLGQLRKENAIKSMRMDRYHYIERLVYSSSINEATCCCKRDLTRRYIKKLAIPFNVKLGQKYPNQIKSDRGPMVEI